MEACPRKGKECGLLRNEFGINDSWHLSSLLLVRKAEGSRYNPHWQFYCRWHLELDTVSPWNDGLTASLLVTVGASATEGFLAPAWGILIVTPTKRPVYFLLVSWLSVWRLEASFGRERRQHLRQKVASLVGGDFFGPIRGRTKKVWKFRFPQAM